MADKLPAGPYRSVNLDDGTSVPFYIIPFDKEGRCEAPQTKDHLVRALSAGEYSHVFLFSHGWNNDWTVATQRYEDFLEGYMRMRRDHGLAAPAGAKPYRPLLVGTFWPSTALVFGEAEEGPGMAAAPSNAKAKAAEDARIANERMVVRELAAEVPPEKRERFYELAQKPGLKEKEALELAELLRKLAASGNDELGIVGAPTAAEIVRVAGSAAKDAAGVDDSEYGQATPGGAAQPAFDLGFLDPRHILRLFTVRQMKDRAGTVGAQGVGKLLRQILSTSEARVHLIGHSYGAKVVLSAVGYGDELSRRVQSMLLLQPAVSHLCFADAVPKADRPGGYRPVLGRVAGSIFSTFSGNDFPLRNTFHLALCREEDLGEAKIAGDGEPPSRYAALGGYGPRRCNEKIVDVHDVGDSYGFDSAAKVYGIRATRTISGHGDISNPSTYWALYSQVVQA